MILPNRKPLRLKGYNYDENGAYFITICAYNKLPLFGRISDGSIYLSSYGIIADKHLRLISTLYKGIHIDKYCIMPNHLHLIIMIEGDRQSCPQCDPSKELIPKLIQSFKSSVSKEIYAAKGQQIRIWQKSYYDHVIRTERKYEIIWNYIDTNPQKWRKDCFYTRY